MQSQLTFGIQVRLVFAGGLNLLLFSWGLDRLGKYSTEEAQAWAHFWLAGTSVLVFAMVWPILRRGSAWLRVGSVLLSVLPIWVLFWVAVDYLHRL
jgi:hypothetical protein